MRFLDDPPVRIAVGGMLAMAAGMGIGRFVYTPILPGMMSELGLSAADAGLIASANYVGYLIGALLAAGGWAHGHERRLAIGGLAASTVLLAATGLTDRLELFLVIRFLAGLASAFLMVFAGIIVFGRLIAAGRPELQALHFAGVGIGIALSGIMTGALFLAGAGWALGWHGAALISAIMLAGVVRILDRGSEDTGASGGEAEPPMPRDPALRLVILAYGLFGFGYIITATFLVAIVRVGAAGQLFESVVWVATGIGVLLSLKPWQMIAARFGLRTTFALGCLLEAAGVVASVTLGGHAGPLIGGVLLGGSFVAITFMGLQIARRLAGNAQRRVFAMMTASFGLGQILGPVFAGWAADYYGGFTVPSLGAALMLVAAAFIAYLSGRRAG